MERRVRWTTATEVTLHVDDQTLARWALAEPETRLGAPSTAATTLDTLVTLLHRNRHLRARLLHLYATRTGHGTPATTDAAPPQELPPPDEARNPAR